MEGRRYQVKLYQQTISLKSNLEKKVILPGGESNPGLPRDRRGYLPLYYRGLDVEGMIHSRPIADDTFLFYINEDE